MLQRAKDRVSIETNGKVDIIQDDMRNLSLPDKQFDIILAAATLHHLRDDADWESVFGNMYRMLSPAAASGYQT